MIGKLPIYRDLFRLTTDLLNELDNLPKKYRYSVGDRMISTSLETLHHLHAAYGAQDAQVRLDAMDRFATEFEMLRTLLRLCNESRLLSQRRLTCLFVSMEGISKQLAGLCHVMGWELEAVAQENLAKLKDRQRRNVIVGEGDNR